MRIITRDEFIPLPRGTVFSLYQSLGNIGPPKVKECKGDWVPDFCYSDLTDSIEYQNTDEFVKKMIEYEKSGETFRLDLTTISRDGLYDADQLFAVYDEEDIKALAIRLYYLVKQPDESKTDSNTPEDSDHGQGDPAGRPEQAGPGDRPGKTIRKGRSLSPGQE